MNELMDAFRCLFELPSDPQEGSELTYLYDYCWYPNESLQIPY